MKAKPKVRISEIADAISGRGRHGHSALYWWMWDHFDQLQKERQGRADWISATEEFAKLGFTNRDKTPLKRDNVRKTWERVVRDRGHVPTKLSRQQPARAPVESTPAPVHAPALQPARATALGPPHALPADDHDELPPDFPFVKERR